MKTKLVRMDLTVRVPHWMTAGEARREVRTLVNNQSNYMDHGPNFEEVYTDTVRVSKLSPAPRG